MCEPFIDRSGGDDSLIPDGEFKPNIKNSVMFVYQWWLHCSIIFVNYTGRPFMQSFSENKKLLYLLIGNFMVITALIFDSSEELREQLELVPYPNDQFKRDVIQMLVTDLLFCYIVEKTCKTVYLSSF